LIASDIENNGTISTPGGKIGLYAGAKVLVSMSPDGRGLSAQVTLPEGSVDNHGNLIRRCRQHCRPGPVCKPRWIDPG